MTARAMIASLAGADADGGTFSPSPLRRNQLVRNALLGAASDDDFVSLSSRLERAAVQQGQRLFSSQTPTEHVYFPSTAMVSLMSSLRDGRSVAVGTAGREGMVGLHVFLGAGTAAVDAVVHIPGVVWRMNSDEFRRVIATSEAFSGLLLRYTHAFCIQLTQTASCNAMHRMNERCARWLLTTCDRVEDDAFPMTHDLLASLLSAHRAGVTTALRAFQDAGVLEHRRGWIHVIDRAGLERASCECYRVIGARFTQLPRLPV